MKKPIRFRYSNGFSVMNSKPGDKWIRGFERLQKMA